MKSFILTIFSLFILTFSYSENPGENFVQFKNQDPIACKSVKYKRSGGNVYRLSYVDLEGNETQLKGKAECEKVVRFSIDGDVYELIPLKANKPTGYKRHFLKAADGHIDVWYYSNEMHKFSDPLRPTEISFMQARIGNGNRFPVSMKEYKKRLLPLYKGCKETNEYKGFNVFSQGVIIMSGIYNEKCAK